MTAFSGHHHRGRPRAVRAFGDPFARLDKASTARRHPHWKRLRRLRRRNLRAQGSIYLVITDPTSHRDLQLRQREKE
jgi:hypothetical protein